MNEQLKAEREAFEALARPRWRHPEDFDQLIKGAPGDYNSIEVQAAWWAWQARAAQAQRADKVEPSHIKIEAWPAQPTSGMIVGMPKGVKITHMPTGLSATCDSERSQHQNRDKAWVELEGKIAAQRADVKALCAVETAMPGCTGFHCELFSGQELPHVGTKLYAHPDPTVTSLTARVAELEKLRADMTEKHSGLFKAYFEQQDRIASLESLCKQAEEALVAGWSVVHTEKDARALGFAAIAALRGRGV